MLFPKINRRHTMVIIVPPIFQSRPKIRFSEIPLPEKLPTSYATQPNAHTKPAMAHRLSIK